MRPDMSGAEQVRSIIVDKANERLTFVCGLSKLRWHMPFAAMTARLNRQWRGERQMNWMLGLHGRAAAHEVVSRAEH